MEEPAYNSNANRLIAYIGERGFNAYLALKYDVEFHQEQQLAVLKGRPIIILPNHQKFDDIGLEGRLIRRNLQTHGNYIMRSNLKPKILLEWFGGIPITRTGELDQLAPEEKKAETKKAIADKNRIYNDIIPALLYENKPVVIHPEGTRKPENQSEANTRKNFKNVLKSQKIYGKRVNFVPIRFKYGNRIAIVNVEEPIQVPDDGIDELVYHWYREVNGL